MNGQQGLVPENYLQMIAERELNVDEGNEIENASGTLPYEEPSSFNLNDCDEESASANPDDNWNAELNPDVKLEVETSKMSFIVNC